MFAIVVAASASVRDDGLRVDTWGPPTPAQQAAQQAGAAGAAGCKR